MRTINALEAPAFSVVIPAFNAAESLPWAVASILDQLALSRTARDGQSAARAVELVIIDDGSTDQTPEVVNRLALPPEVFMIFRRTRNGGPAAARNLGAKLATGRYVLFLDADDRLMPGAITAFEAAIAANGEPDAVYGGFILQQPGRPAKRYPAPQTQGDRLADFRAFLETRPRPLTPGAVCVHRRAIGRLAFPERLRIAEDLVFFGQLVATSRVVSVPDLVLERFGVARRGTDRAILRADELLHAVDILFDPAILPPPFMTLRNRQLGMTYLTLFRAFQSAGYQTEARRYFWKGARLVPMRAARPTYLRKILRGMFPAARLPEIVDMPAGDANARREFRQ